MKLNRSIALTVLSGASLVGLLAGCYPLVPKENMIQRTTEYNMVAEATGNRMLLLNIIRASQRRPMYFTTFGKLTGNITYAFGTGGLSVPFGAIGSGANGSYSVTPSATYTSSPLFDMAVLDTKEFMCGVMKPVSMATIEYYWSQGWSKDLLLHLFIRRIDINSPGEKPYENYPEDWGEFRRFQDEIRTAKWDIVPDPNRESRRVGTVDAKQAARLKDLIEVQKAGLALKKSEKDGDKWDVCSTQPTYIFQRTKDGRRETYPSDSKSPKMRVYIRSPEAILYYLGEIVRVEMLAAAEGRCPKVPEVYSADRLPGSLASLFHVEIDGKGVAPAVSVEYEGTRYVIPRQPDSTDANCHDQSMHVLSLVSQLIGQQKSSTELPATGVVNVIGR